MFGWELPPQNSGGLGVACLGLAKNLANQGAEITFVLPRKSGDNSFFRVIPANISYNYKQIEVNSPLSPYLTPEKYRNNFLQTEENNLYGTSLFNEVCRYAECAKKIAKIEKFDVIHAHDWLSFGAGINAKKVSGKPFIAHVHATEFDRGGEGRINQEVYKKEKEGMEVADKVIAVSNFTKNIIIKHYGISPEKIEVIHNGGDHIELKNSNSKEDIFKAFKDSGYKIVVSYGRITIQKGIDYFIKMAKKVLEYDKKVIFVIAGSGDMEQQIIHQAAVLGISDKVFFTGFLRGEKCNNLYRASDIFIMPSVSEPFGLAPLEFLINGTPVLISKQSGVSEVLKNALKVDFWDTDDMANKVLTALHNKSMCNCLAENGQKEVKEISWAKAAQKCINIYKSLSASQCRL